MMVYTNLVAGFSVKYMDNNAKLKDILSLLCGGARSGRTAVLTVGHRMPTSTAVTVV